MSDARMPPRPPAPATPPATPAHDMAWRGESCSVDGTVALGAAVGAAARAGDLVALIGELGAGKTQFVRGLAQGLGLDPRAVSSPTFVLSQEHAPGHAGLVLVHIDAYRIRGREDLESIGWDQDGHELRRGAVLAIEWADRLGLLLGADLLEVRLEHAQESRRIIEVRPHGKWVERWPTLLAALREAPQVGREIPAPGSDPRMT